MAVGKRRQPSCRLSDAPERRSRARIDALVVEVLARSETPLSAHEIALRAAEDGEQLFPSQIYRTLSRLGAQGSVRRLELLAAYVLQRTQCDACLVCSRCEAVQFVSSAEMVSRVERLAHGLGFRPSRIIIEAKGRCSACALIDERQEPLSRTSELG